VALDPQFAARGVFVTALHPQHGELAQLAPLLAGMDRPRAAMALPDAAVTDSEHLLKEAGVSAQQITRWRERRVVA